MPLVVQDHNLNMHFGYQCAGDAEIMTTALGFGTEEGLTDPALFLLGGDIIDAWTLSMKAICPLTYVMGPHWADVGKTDAENLRFDYSGTVAGEGSSVAYPPNTAYLVRKVTTAPGRHGRGRMYIPGVGQGAAFDNGVLLTGFLDGLNDALGEFITAALLIEGVTELQLYHETESPSPSQVVALVGQSKVATQRRRLRP